MREKRRQVFDTLRLHTRLPKDLCKLVLSYHSSGQRLILHSAEWIQFPDATSGNVRPVQNGYEEVGEYRWSMVPYDTDREMNLVDHSQPSLPNSIIFPYVAPLGNTYLWRYKQGFIFADDVYLYYFPTIDTPILQAVRIPSIVGVKHLMGDRIIGFDEDEQEYGILNLDRLYGVRRFYWEMLTFQRFESSSLSCVYRDSWYNLFINRRTGGMSNVGIDVVSNVVSTHTVSICKRVLIETHIDRSHKVVVAGDRIYFLTRTVSRSLAYLDMGTGLDETQMRIWLTDPIPEEFIRSDLIHLVLGNRLCMFKPGQTDDPKDDKSTVSHGIEYHPETDSWHKVDCNITLDPSAESLQMIEFDQLD